MRKYVIAVVVLVAMGLFMGLYLIPNETEVAAMQSYDATNRVGGMIEGAEGRFIEGDRSSAVMAAVADQYLSEERDVRPLIPEYAAYMQENPTDGPVRQRLAQMYRVTGNARGYLEHSRILAEQAPNEKNLYLLADAYNMNQAYPQQEQTLQLLIERTEGSNPDYYADLATIQALLGKDQAVLQTVQALKERHPDYASYKITRIVVQSYINSGQLEEAYAEAELWISKEVDPLQIAEMTDALHYGGRPDLAVKLSEPHRVMADDNPVLMMSYINALLAIHEKEKAYAILKEDHEGGVLDSSLYYPFMRLAIMLEPDYALPIVADLQPKIFEEDESLDLLELTYDFEHEPLRGALVELFDVEPYRDDKYVLQAVVALIRRDNDEDTKIEKALAGILPPNERVHLAKSCARNQKEVCFNEVVSRYPAYPEMTPREIDEIVTLYITAERPAEVKTPIYEQANLRNLTAVNYSQARLAASLGDSETVQMWLQRDGVTASSTDITTLYFTATDNRQLSTGILIAQTLYQREPSVRHREYLASVYIQDGQEEKALPLIRAAIQESPDKVDSAMEDNYIAALVELAPQDEEYRDELRHYILPKLDDPEVTPERKLELVFALINTRQGEYAKPYVNQYAAYDTQWNELYRQFHSINAAANGSDSGEYISLYDRSRDYRVRVANSPRTKESVKNLLAYSLLEDGYREDATAIFFELAQNKPADSQEVEDLLYIWGPRLNDEQLAWIARRADGANTQSQRIAWAERLANQTDDFGLMRYVSKNPQLLNHPALRDRYFTAMAQHSEESRFVDGMKPWIDATNDVAALQDYTEAAIGGTFPDGAMYALRRMNQLDPNHQWTLKQLAVLNYGRADYSEAEKSVNRFISNASQMPPAAARIEDNSPYEVLYYKAGLLKREGKKQEAMAYYQELVNLAPREAKDATRQALYYNSLYQLGHRDLAKQGFTGLLKAYPNDKGLLADYLDVLLEGKETALARQVANQYDRRLQRSAAQQPQPRALPVNASNVKAVIPHENGRELELRYDQNAPRQLMPQTMPASAQGWVEGVKRGHNSIVIAAKPGYELRFTPTSGQYSRVVASPVRTSSPKERLEVRQQLRLQLLYARMELDSGQIDNARQRIAAIRPYFTDDAQYLGYAANVENAAGNWPKAVRLLSDAQYLRPENEDIARLQRDIDRLYGQEIKLDHTWRSIGDNNEHITTLSGRVRPTHNTELGLSLQTDSVDADQIRRGTDGRLEDYEGSRQRAELYGAYYFDNGDALRGALYANNDTAGVGGYYSFNNPLGRSEVFAEYRRPYWEFTEAVVEQATRDSVGVSHVVTIDSDTFLSARGALNRYNSEVDDDVAQSAEVDLYVSHRVIEGSPDVRIGYNLDAEYVRDYELRTDSAGNGYRTLPITSREVHYPFVMVSDDVTKQTYAEAMGGWAFDRLGDNGPQVSGRIVHDITDDLEAELRASYGLQDNDTDESFTQVGGHLRYQF